MCSLLLLSYHEIILHQMNGEWIRCNQGKL
nr:MAG TPA: hypothetical protein [Caudoviricetes sp.]